MRHHAALAMLGIVHAQNLLPQSSTAVVATCTTNDDATDYHTNICSGLTWNGWGTKLRALEKFVSTLPPQQLVVFVDSDVFVNPSRAHAIRDTFLAFNSQVVASGEPACWVGRACHEEDIRKYYRGTSGKAPFLNAGGIAGYAGAIRSCLYNAYAQGDDDQRVWAQIAAQNKNVAIDTDMRLFGTLLAAKNSHWLWDFFATPITCMVDGIIKVRGCAFREPEITVGTRCDISAQGATPCFWHGNGPAKKVWNTARRKRDACLKTTTHSPRHSGNTHNVRQTQT